MNLDLIALRYREGTKADLPQLKALGILAYSQFFPQLDDEGRKRLGASLEDEDKLGQLLNISRCFVSVAGDQLVGMVHLVPSGNPWDVFPAEWAYIRMLGVHPDWQGRGTAKELTKRCIDHAVATGETTIALHTSEMMDAARHIYEGLGFRQEREIAPRFGKRYWLYAKSL